MPVWLLREYLLELGGAGTGEEVRGPGWTARLEAARGAYGIGRVTVTIEGPSAAGAMAALRAKAQRGGG